MKYILCFTISIDLHAEAVEKTINKSKQYSFIRINTDNSTQFNYPCITNDEFFVVINGKKIPAEEISAMWIRKPYLNLFSRKESDENKKIKIKHIFEEFSEIWPVFLIEAKKNAIYTLPSYPNVQANRKINQLNIAKKVGWDIPSFIVSYSKQEILSYIKSWKRTLTKPLSTKIYEKEGQEILFGTHVFSSKEFELFFHEREITYPFFCEEYIEKLYELRITVVGKKVFACKIDSQKSNKSKLNWKKIHIYSLPHEIYNLPKEVEEKCINVCKELNLDYGAIDVIVSPNGKYYFVEINPAGQYLWIEQKTGMQISKAIADLLMNPKKNSLFADTTPAK